MSWSLIKSAWKMSSYLVRIPKLITKKPLEFFFCVWGGEGGGKLKNNFCHVLPGAMNVKIVIVSSGTFFFLI